MTTLSSRFTLVVAAALTLSACGGGSNSDGDNNTPPPPPGTTTYTISGTVTGLQDNTTVVLQNNGGNALSRTQNGAFTFTTALAAAATYSVTVSSQPSGQVCTVSRGSGTVGSANVSNVDVLCTPPVAKFVYVANKDSNTIGAYSINATSGSLSVLASSPFASSPAPVEVTSDPAGKTLFVTIQSSSIAPTRLAAYAIDAASGALTQNPISPFNLGNPPPPLNDAATYHRPLVHRSGQFIYVGVETGKVYGLEVQSNGTLADIQGPTTVGNLLRPGVIDPTGKFLYLPNEKANPIAAGQVSLFQINQTTGVLQTVGPFDTGALRPIAAALTASGKFLLVSHIYSGGSSGPNTSGLVVMAADAQSGTLTQVAGSPFAQGSLPSGILTHPRKNIAYVQTGSAASPTISAYQIDATTGVLTPITGSPFGNRSGGVLLSIDPSGRFLYLVNDASKTIDAYAIDQTSGALSGVTGMPVGIVASTPHVAMDPSGRYLYVTQSGTGLNINTIVSYAADPSTGALTEVNRLATGGNPGRPEPVGRQ